MKKTIIIVIVVVLIILIIVGIFFLLRQNGSSSATVYPPNNLPVASTSIVTPSIPTSTTITLGTSQGSVTTTNFYQTADYITQDQQTVAVKDTSNYIIAYNVQDSSFAITLMSTPLEAVRQEAEGAFLSSLGISQQAACKLTVYEGVPAGVSDQYIGQNFQLSFCGGPATL